TPPPYTKNYTLSLHDALPISELMQMVPQALLKQEIIEGIIPESEEHRKTCKNIEQVLLKRLNKLQELPPNQLLANRKKRYRKFRSEEHTSELQSRFDLVCRLL